ncbi:MAG: histidine kinase [Acidobacteria bacterium]|nr:histidine kinase [Acidobacteriota bacterium]
MHGHSGPHRVFFAGELIAFTAALLITVILLALTLRAAKLRGNPGANIVFAVCALLWSAGGLTQAILIAMGVPNTDWQPITARFLQYCGVLAFPIPILAIWKPFASSSHKKAAIQVLQVAACLSGAMVAALVLWTPAGLPIGLRRLTAYHDSAILAMGAIIALRRGTTPRSIYIPSWAIVTAICLAALIMSIDPRLSSGADPGLSGLGMHLIMLVVLCSFFLFARFRFADVFIRYGVRIVLAGTWAAIIGAVAQWWNWSRLIWVISPEVAHVFGIVLVSLVLILSFTFVDERMSRVITRWLFRTPDYRRLAQTLGEKLGRLTEEPAVISATESAVREAIDSSDAKVCPVNELSQWPPGIGEGEIVESDDAAAIVPITSTGKVSHALRVTTGLHRPGLVIRDLNYLRAVATHCGNRLDSLAREQESIERQSREAVLLQQVTEAELRALRAQVNPHFLFNSLNTIADLIVRDPKRAEAMTLRLSAVFRHVLAHSHRPLTSIRGEMEFLRSYLHIEEARFGERLKVEIDMAPEIAGLQVPSLILQPLVENALKHGLGPKIGVGHLRITARRDGGEICFRIEDDGLGLAAPPGNGRPEDEPQSLGLANVAERLRALYQERATIVLEPRQGGGACATVRIPASGAVVEQ